jgi:uncharacterized membrane protein (DUF106 family)
MNSKQIVKSLDTLALAIGFIFFFGIMVIPHLRDWIAVAAGYVIGWLPAYLPFDAVILVLATVTGLYANIIQKHTMDWEFMRSQQEKMKSIQAAMKEAQLSGDQGKIQQLQSEQMKMMSDQGKMMQMQFKPMLYIGIISIPLFMWAAYRYIDGNVITVTFPFWGTHNVSELVFGPVAYWYYWYFVCSMPVSQIIRKALNIAPMN